MKHNKKITAILISMFIITQIIGLFIIVMYTNGLQLPYGMEPPNELKQEPQGLQILFAFIIAITLFLILVKIKAETFIRAWFFIVTTIAMGLTLTAVLYFLKVSLLTPYMALAIALPLTYFKLIKRNILIHNITELIIYPGIAAVFVPLLDVFWIIILLLAISLYDIWAVWHSEFMQKIAKYQINHLKFFTGFFVPYADKKQREKIKLLKEKYSNNSEELEKNFKKQRIRINLAILGGGDVIFPIITAGVFYKTYMSIYPALIISLFSTLALIYLFIAAKKGKFYPAMPFLTIGIYLSMILCWIIF